MSNIFDTLIEVELSNPEDFLKIKETLTRIGIANYKDKRLFQSCHILHKQGRYYIVHFLEMFFIDGNGKNFSLDDRIRRNTIANLLQEWNLLKIKNPSVMSDGTSMKGIKIVAFREKNEWTLTEKYGIGSK